MLDLKKLLPKLLPCLVFLSWFVGYCVAAKLSVDRVYADPPLEPGAGETGFYDYTLVNEEQEDEEEIKTDAIVIEADPLLPDDTPWCARETPCQTSDDCRPTPWATNFCGRDGLCHFASKKTPEQRQYTRTRMREVFNELGLRGDVRKLLLLVSRRESNRIPHAVHKLSGDKQGALRAWKRLASKYNANPAYEEQERWTSGLGLYGHNPAYALLRFDVHAPPEVLCDEKVATQVYVETLKAAYKKLSHGIECGGKEFNGLACDESGACRPSWRDLHRMASMGKMCPLEDDDRRVLDFERRAAMLGLASDEGIPVFHLGHDKAHSPY